MPDLIVYSGADDFCAFMVTVGGGIGESWLGLKPAAAAE
jgi:hypothetical protein